MIRSCLKTSPLHKPTVEYCMALALATRGKKVLPQLTALISRLYSGWVQSAVCERANKVLKGCMRDNPSLVHPPMRVLVTPTCRRHSGRVFSLVKYACKTTNPRKVQLKKPGLRKVSIQMSGRPKTFGRCR